MCLGRAQQLSSNAFVSASLARAPFLRCIEPPDKEAATPRVVDIPVTFCVCVYVK